MDDLPEPADPLRAVDAAMVRIRRSIARRRLGKLFLRELPAVDLAHVAVLDAIDLAPGEASVGDVADRLGVDPSRASRLVAGAVEAGLVERVATPADGRRIGLRLTTAGRAIEERVGAVRRARFSQVLDRLRPEDRARFADLLTAFVDGLDALDDGQP